MARRATDEKAKLVMESKAMDKKSENRVAFLFRMASRFPESPIKSPADQGHTDAPGGTGGVPAAGTVSPVGFSAASLDDPCVATLAGTPAAAGASATVALGSDVWPLERDFRLIFGGPRISRISLENMS